TYIVQANAFYSHVGRLQLEIADGKATLLNYRAIPLDQSIPEEPTTKAAVDGLIADIESLYGKMYTQQIGVVTGDFMEFEMDRTTLGDHSTPVGNLITDIYRNAFQTDIAIQAGGSTAQGLWAGPIVPADLYRMISYGFNTDNTLGYHMATFSITGADLIAGLEFGVASIEEDDEFMSQTSGMRYTYDPGRLPMQRIVSVEINGQPIDPARTYTVASNEFAPMILSAIGIPISNVRVFGGDTTEFGTIMQAVVQMQTLTPLRDGRIQAVQSNDVASTTINRTIANAYPNPCTASTELRFTLDKASHVAIRLMDMTGKVLLDTSAEGAAGENIVQLDVHGISTGRYLCLVETPGHRQTTMITVQR
ncbi:MAG TPA: 5'-nucleotidase C-terminal domain-containing protein, partial [Candidatus Kapabacteria bacterium]|nr:5'-nucleotidase C-terminal domain-containing protein [Candidatus Kapabacteria bacterium]